MVPRRLFSWNAALLVLVGLAATEVTAAPIQFTGNVVQDFNPAVDNNIHVTPVSSIPLNIGQSDWITNRGWVSGWSIQDIRTNYDSASDTLYVGVNTFKNANGQHAPFGQANGDPAGTPAPYDPAHLGGDKSFALAIAGVNATSPTQPGTPLIIAGIPADKTLAGSGINGFTVSQFDASRATAGLAYQFGKSLPQFSGDLAFDPSPAHPQLEFTIKNFSKIPGLDPSSGYWVSAYAGSSLDGVAGEAYLSWTKIPANSEQNIPEPTTWLAWALAAGGVAALRSRRARG
ncbi:MAG: hypothetical protein U0790_11550 [Isosphaeraceae bacterium]